MPRVKKDWRSASTANYKDFCKKHPNISISIDDWRNVIYTSNDAILTHILETGESYKLSSGFGEISINKKKRRKMRTTDDGVEKVNLPIDWKKTKEKGKVIYNFNYHTEGYFFGWVWFKDNVRLKNSDCWRFKPSRSTSRLLSHYIKTDIKYQNIYREWRYFR